MIVFLSDTFLLYEKSYDRYTLRGVSKLRAIKLTMFIPGLYVLAQYALIQSDFWLSLQH